MSSTLSEPYLKFDTTHHGSTVVLAALVAITITAVLSTTRAIVAPALKRDMGIDHSLSFSATILGIIQTALVVKAARSGIGRHQSTLTEDELSTADKYLYSGELLFVIVLTLTKLSMASFYRRLTQRGGVIRFCNGLLLAIILWAVFSVFALAFQCHVPAPWIYSSSHCAGQGALWYLISVFNILIDIVLSVLPVPLIAGLQMPLQSRWILCGLLGFRICVPAVAIAQLTILPSYLRSEDTTWTAVPFTVCMQVIMNLSIVATTLPFLHRVGANLHTGRLGNNIIISDEMEMTRQGYGHSSGSNGGSKAGGSKGGVRVLSLQGRSSRRQQSSTTDSRFGTPSSGGVLRPSGYGATIRSTVAHEPDRYPLSNQGQGLQSESQEKLTNTEDGILQTTTVSRTVEEARSMR